jgi:mannose-1-phosphate guanylyltransferase/phosphomannomutase
VFDEESWVLVLPDAVEPCFHLYAESESQQRSERLVHDYATKISAYLP